MTDQMRTAYPQIKFQMWDAANKRMFVWEKPNHRVLIAAFIAKDEKDVRLLPFSGLKDSSEKDLYLDDVCWLTVGNEFGSMEVLLVQISYFPDFVSQGFNLRGRTIDPRFITKVEKIGNLNANPELLDLKP